MRWVIASIAALSAVAGACLLPEVNDFAGSSLDAAAESFVAPEAAAPDSAVTPEAGADAKVVCPDTSFCDDFDDGPLGAKWTSKDELDGKLTLETGGLSAPNRLLMSLTPLTGFVRRAGLTKTFAVTANPKRITCSVMVRVEGRANPPDGDTQLLEIWEHGSKDDDVYLKIGQADTYLREDSLTADGSVTAHNKTIPAGAGAIANGVWTRVVLDVDFVGKAAALTLTPNASVPTTGSIPITPGVGITKFDVILAEPDDHDDGPAKASFDDLRCDFTL